MIPQSVGLAAGLATSILIARGLGPKGMGNYALILSVSGLATALSDLGIGQTAIRFASRAAATGDTAGQLAILRWAFRLRMLLAGTISTTVFIFAPILAGTAWKEATLSPLVRLSLLTGLFTAAASIPTVYFQSLKRFKMNAAVMVGQTLLTAAGIVLIAVLKSWSLELIITVSVVATGLGAIVFMILIPRESFFIRQEFRRQIGKTFINLLRAPRTRGDSSASLDSTSANSFVLFMLVSTVTVALTMRSDVWLMGYFLDKSQIGLYSVATRFTLPLVVVLNALNTALWPRASSITSHAKISELIGKTVRLSGMVTFGGLLYSILVPLAMPLLFGSPYRSGIFVAQILCFRYCLSILICPIGVIGYSFGMVKVFWWINIIQLIAVVIIDILLLPRIGAVGAGLALIANELINLILVSTIIWRRLVDIKDIEPLMKTSKIN
jgi:O-antigen/teichoic acid export membrane protein